MEQQHLLAMPEPIRSTMGVFPDNARLGFQVRRGPFLSRWRWFIQFIQRQLKLSPTEQLSSLFLQQQRWWRRQPLSRQKAPTWQLLGCQSARRMARISHSDGPSALDPNQNLISTLHALTLFYSFYRPTETKAPPAPAGTTTGVKRPGNGAQATTSHRTHPKSTAASRPRAGSDSTPAP